MRRRTMRQPGMTATPAKRTAGAARAGFTVLEVMLAMGIFVVGFAAVASLLPAAITLQKQAVEDVTADQVARHAEATLRARPILLSELVNVTGGGTNYPYPSPVNTGDVPDQPGLWALPIVSRANGNRHLLEKWSVADRSYPSNLAEVSERSYFWVPMVLRVRNSTPPQPDDFVIYVLILRPQEGQYAELSPGGSAKYIYTFDSTDFNLINNINPGGMPYANRGEDPPSPFRDSHDLINPRPFISIGNNYAPEAPWVPKICAIRTVIRQGTDGTKLSFHRNNIPYNLVQIDNAGNQFSGANQPRPVAEGYSTYENLKIRPTDLIIDQWGKVHTVVTAHEEEVTLNGAIRCPQNWFDNTTGLLQSDHTIWIWYAVPPARPKSAGASYSNYVLSPGRSALVKVVPVQGVVIR
ncbi:MAG: hypothetical protein IT442_08125 [Phycisphaeraceae bacterium]|nr:hypothetical protein [Phycisphaeraceae bacterium]